MKIELVVCEKCAEPLHMGFDADNKENTVVYLGCPKCQKTVAQTTLGLKRNQILTAEEARKGKNGPSS